MARIDTDGFPLNLIRVLPWLERIRSWSTVPSPLGGGDNKIHTNSGYALTPLLLQTLFPRKLLFPFFSIFGRMPRLSKKEPTVRRAR